MSGSFFDVPPELIVEIAENLSKTQDVVAFALTSKLVHGCCTPVLYRKITWGHPRWEMLFNAGTKHLPHWVRHIRILAWKIDSSVGSPVDFRPLYPILERLEGLREIESVDQRLKTAAQSGIEELTDRVPWLKVFRWKNPIAISNSSKVLLYDMVLNVCPGTLSYLEKPQLHWRNLQTLDIGFKEMENSEEAAVPTHNLAPNYRFTELPQWPCITTLSSYHAGLTTLNLTFEHEDAYYVHGRRRYREKQPWPPVSVTNLLFSNTFPCLIDFYLDVNKFEWPPFLKFLEAHPALRSFGLSTDELDKENIALLQTRLPNVEYIRGCNELLENLFMVTSEPFYKVTQLFAYEWKASLYGIELHAKYIFPKLPNLVHCLLSVVQDFDDIPRDTLVEINRMCPHLKTLEFIVSDEYHRDITTMPMEQGLLSYKIGFEYCKDLYQPLEPEAWRFIGP